MSNKFNSSFRNLFYLIKPIIPRGFQIYFRRKIVEKKISQYRDVWPINKKAGTPPDNWKGWPEQKQFAFVLTHDVERNEGQHKCYDLMRLEQKLGFRSSFNFVPKRYPVCSELREKLTLDGFEVGVHGLYHDGKLYQTKEIFDQRAIEINQYLKQWQAVGFRSPAMHHNLDWLTQLDIEYDTSTFDTDPFEPQSDGVNTIFPFWISRKNSPGGFVELPYTLVQDFTLFILMNETSPKIWQEKLDWIAQKGGMALLNTHPDYIYFGNGKKSIEEFPAEYYEQFLSYVNTRYENQCWHVLPKELANFWKNRQVEYKKIF